MNIPLSLTTHALRAHTHTHAHAPPEAHQRFIQINAAYEVLRDADTRGDYDYLLAHPEQFYANQMRYYRRRALKIGVTPILVTLVTLISIFQAYYKRKKYQWAQEWALEQQVSTPYLLWVCSVNI